MTTSVPLMNVALALGLVGVALGRIPIHRQPGFLPGAALALWMNLSTALSPWPPHFEISGWSYSWIAVYCWAAAPASTLRPALWVMIAGGLVSLSLGLVQFVVGYNIDARPFRVSSDGPRLLRASGLYSHHIRYGDGMAMWGALMPLASSHLATGARRAFLTIGAAIGGVTGVACSSSRGAFMALTAGWGAGLVRLLGFRRALPGMLSMAALLLLGGWILWKLHPGRIESMFLGQDGRWPIWKDALEAYHRRPIFGVGNNGFETATTALINAGQAPMPIEGSAATHAHNSLLGMLTLYGVVGLGLWLWWLVSVSLGLWRRSAGNRAITSVLMAALGVSLIGGLTEDLANLAAPRYQLFLALALAFLMTTTLDDKDRGDARQDPLP